MLVSLSSTTAYLNRLLQKRTEKTEKNGNRLPAARAFGNANDNLNDNLLADARYYSSLQKKTEITEKLQKLARLRQAPPATVRCAYDDRLAVCSCDEQNPPSTSLFRHIVHHCASKKHIPFYIHFSFLWKYANGQRVHIVNTWW